MSSTGAWARRLQDDRRVRNVTPTSDWPPDQYVPELIGPGGRRPSGNDGGERYRPRLPVGPQPAGGTKPAFTAGLPRDRRLWRRNRHVTLPVWAVLMSVHLDVGPSTARNRSTWGISVGVSRGRSQPLMVQAQPIPHLSSSARRRRARKTQVRGRLSTARPGRRD